jgi:hypothetical protein
MRQIVEAQQQLAAAVLLQLQQQRCKPKLPLL